MPEETTRQAQLLRGGDWNTLTGITESLALGLLGMHELRRKRSEVHKSGVLLDDFVVLGGLWLTRDGNLLVLEEPLIGWAPVVELDGALRVLTDVRLSGACKGLPEARQPCEECKSLFTVEQAIRAQSERDLENRALKWRHRWCHQLELMCRSRKVFADVVTRAGFQPAVLNEIPNEYCKCVLCMPWQSVLTLHGQLKIGWRKHVISIDWMGTGRHFPGLFTSEKVTESSYYVHAYGYDKAVEYLTRLRQELEKPEEKTP